MSEKPSNEKRPYTMSDKALAQRREAAQHSTGPRTPEGKARSSRNAWVHGERSAARQYAMDVGMSLGTLGKPCHSTCPIHPSQDPEHPCRLVLDGMTGPGGDCLDKTVYVDAFNAIMDGMERGEYGAVESVIGRELAGALEIIKGMRDEIAESGVMIDQTIFGKEGPVGKRRIPNPIIAHYTKMLRELGINISELMVSPKSREKLLDPDDENDPVRRLFEGLAGAAGKPVSRNQAIDGEYEDLGNGD